MGKEYTPKRAAIRFANPGAAMTKVAVQSVAPIAQVGSDSTVGADKFSGVVRHDIDNWKHNTKAYLFPPTISAVNPELILPLTPETVYITGSNFAPNSKIYLDGVLMMNNVTFINENVYSFTPPTSSVDKGVFIEIIRPDFRSGSMYDAFFYESYPTITSVSSSVIGATSEPKIYNDGGTVFLVSGSHFKPDSVVVFTCIQHPEMVVSSSVTSLEDTTKMWVQAPATPPTGSYNLPMVGPFKVQVISPSGRHSNDDKTITSCYRQPIITSVEPDLGEARQTYPYPLKITGKFFLPSAQSNVFLTSSGISPAASQLTPSGSLPYSSTTLYSYAVTNQLPSTASLYVINTEEPDAIRTKSNEVQFPYVVPVPIIDTVSFSNVEPLTTGSLGAKLYIAGRFFSGTIADYTVTRVFLVDSQFGGQTELFGISSLTTRSLVVDMPTSMGSLANNQRYDVALSNSAGIGIKREAILFLDVPKITSIAQNTGSVDDVSPIPVTINGGTFYNETSTAFFSASVFGNKAAAIVGAAQPNVMLVNAPDPKFTETPPIWRQVDVYVENSGRKSNVIKNGYLYAEKPFIASMVPNVGSANHGWKATLTLTNLLKPRSDGTSRRDGDFITLASQGTASVSYDVLTNNTIAVNVPPSGVMGPVYYITLKNGVFESGLNFNALATHSIGYNYVTDPTITSLSTSFIGSTFLTFGVSGTQLHVFGTSFFNTDGWQISVGSAAPVPATRVSDSHIYCTIPNIATSGDYPLFVNDTGNNVSVTLSLPNGVKYFATPFISAVDPLTVSRNVAGNIVGIAGANFTGFTRAYLSGTPDINGTFMFAGSTNYYATNIAQVTGTTATNLNIALPSALTYGNVNLVLKNEMTFPATVINFLSSSFTNIRYETQPVVTSITPTMAAINAAGITVTVTGSGFLTGTNGSGYYTTVTIPGTGQTINVSSITNAGTRMTFTTPTNWPVSGSYQVVVANGNLQAVNKPTLSYVKPGVEVYNILPNNGIITTDATNMQVWVMSGTKGDTITYGDE